MSNIQNFFKRYLPIVKADEGEEELVDPQTVLRVSDSLHNVLSFERMQTCYRFFEIGIHSIKNLGHNHYSYFFVASRFRGICNRKKTFLE